MSYSIRKFQHELEPSTMERRYNVNSFPVRDNYILKFEIRRSIIKQMSRLRSTDAWFCSTSYQWQLLRVKMV